MESNERRQTYVGINKDKVWPRTLIGIVRTVSTENHVSKLTTNKLTSPNRTSSQTNRYAPTNNVLITNVPHLPLSALTQCDLRHSPSVPDHWMERHSWANYDRFICCAFAQPLPRLTLQHPLKCSCCNDESCSTSPFCIIPIYDSLFRLNDSSSFSFYSHYILWTDISSHKFIADNYTRFLDTFHSYTYPIQSAAAVRRRISGPRCWLSLSPQSSHAII